MLHPVSELEAFLSQLKAHRDQDNPMVKRLIRATGGAGRTLPYEPGPRTADSDCGQRPPPRPPERFLGALANVRKYFLQQKRESLEFAAVARFISQSALKGNCRLNLSVYPSGEENPCCEERSVC
jgi:hypothetical protein